MTIEDYLQRNASLYPDKIAIICRGEEITYSRLWQLVESKAMILREQYQPHHVAAIRTSQSIDFLVTYFALHVAEAVALPLEHDIPQGRFEEIANRYACFIAPEEVADILFTTGTTGKSKGVMISHRTIIADAENLIDSMEFSHDLLFVINGPLNHIGSLSKVYPTVMMGATLYILESLKDLDAFFAAFDYPCTKVATFLVPASIRILLQLAKNKLATYADKIDFIETGAAPMAHSDMLELCRLLPKTRLYNTFASTETGIVATYNYNDGECLVGCLGRPMKHSRILITDEGRVACQGPTLMTGYADEEELTAQVMHDNTVFTADNGRIDDLGRLHLMGRNDDVINVGGYKVAPTEVEDVALAFPGVKDCICVSDVSPVLGTRLKLLYVRNGDVEFSKKDLAKFIASKLEVYKVPQAYEQVDEIHRTFNGKLDRKFYRQKS
jgi:acyl-CoA synthetase (AMP-forming)/AMP-acid ligase II